MKYVLFLDILGFKDRLKGLSQKNAKELVSRFSSTIYDEWKDNEKCKRSLEGYIVSDSLIINTQDTSLQSLNDLLDVAKALCQKVFSQNEVLLRGAIAKGEYDKIAANELSTLCKNLFVGQAYVDAYLLEGSVKTLGIVLSKEVFEELENSGRKDLSVYDEKINGDKKCILIYMELEYLLEQQNLSKLIKLAIKSNWLPHYYNTIYISMKKDYSTKTDVLFNRILDILKNTENGWRDLDKFICNAFDKEVNGDFQKRFLRFIRNKLQ